MRQLISGGLALALLWCGGASAGPEHDALLAATDALMAKRVSGGLVDYRAMVTERAELLHAVSLLAEVNLDDLASPAERKAFWINAYNLTVIKSVVDAYPIDSPLDRPGFFKDSRHTIAGRRVTLDQIEKDILIGQFGDERVHFALVCAAKGCPQIVGRAYHPAEVEEQLEQRARDTLNDPRYVRLDHTRRTVHVVEIFRWYEQDFLSGARSVLDYLNRYRAEPIPRDYSIAYIPYDWSLNEAPSAIPAAGRGEHSSIRAYTPSRLLFPGQWEGKVFCNLYTQTSYFDDEGDRRDQQERSTYLTATGTLLYGMAPQWNVGVDLVVKSVLLSDEDDSPFEVFSFPSHERARTALTAFAAKVKHAPLTSLPNLSVQMSLLIPTARDLEGIPGEAPFLDYKGLQWLTQVLYDQPFGERVLLYVENDYLWRFDATSETFVTPLKAILNYYPAGRATLYGLTEVAPSWDGLSWDAYYLQTGAGVKYQLRPWLEFEVSATLFPLGKSKGAGFTQNIGVRVLR